MIIKIGTIITCPGCYAKIARVKQEIHKGECIKTKNLEGIEQELIPYTQTVCKKCGMPWFRNGKIYTENGWMPR